MIKHILLEISDNKLPGRNCGRCGKDDFREVIHNMYEYAIKCADCSYNNREKCGRIVSFLIKENGDFLERCGDMVKSRSTCTNESQSTHPLAICFNCNKLVDLQ